MAKEQKKKAEKAEAGEKTSASHVAPKNYTPRLKTKYFKEIVPALQKEFSFKSPMRAPRLHKIAINQGVGDAVADRKIMEGALNEMSIITGQKPVATLSKKDISNFKVRKGVAIGVKVTLRSDRMYEFLDRFISTALPRIRDFKGISKNGFDGRGNYTLGITEQIIFPEINIDKVNKVRGMDITFVTSARTNAEAHALLREFGVPFKKEEDEKKKGHKAEMIFGGVAKKDIKKETKKDSK
ncbi:MAG: 50S ribosomal protein L5 [Bacteroidetes bacterium]|nr:50S ribosomal protein L5 [Bacteroidota bacterium]